MTHLIACLSSGKGTWIEVNKIIAQGTWEKVFLITNDFGKENYKNENNAELIVLDNMQPVDIMRDILISELKDKVNIMDVAVNFVSGTGKEHMALLAALLKIGSSLRMVTSGESEVKEL